MHVTFYRWLDRLFRSWIINIQIEMLQDLHAISLNVIQNEYFVEI